MFTKYLRILSLLSTIVFIYGCNVNRYYTAPDPLPDDRQTCRKPAFVGAKNDFTDGFEQQFVLQGEQMVDLSRPIRTFTGDPKEAYNIDEFDEVANSSWFTNRNAKQRMPVAEIVQGANTCSGPDTSGCWEIIRAKAEGVTPGFTIIDPKGVKYVIKFDPIGYSGLNSGSEIIGSLLFYAAGYNVPENCITCFDPKILRMSDKVKFLDEKGRSRFMNGEDLKAMLARVEYRADGLVRATASKYVAGEVLGPFKYEKTRKDDPNDFIPHQHRREIRGLGIVNAWLNHIDFKSANSMDSYVTVNGKSYVKHYLIDFGTILGSGGRGPQPKYRGYESEIDPHKLFFRIVTLGLYVPKWERVPHEVEYPCIGRFHSEFFEPDKFTFIFPNPAYDDLTDRDGFWGAKLVMSFTDEQLQAVVEKADYPDPEAAEYLLQTIIERRDKTGRYWFDRVCPLDSFTIEQSREEGQSLDFKDIAVETGLESEDAAVYRYTVYHNGKEIASAKDIGSSTKIELPLPDEWNVNEPPENFPGHQWKIALQKRRDNGKWSDPVDVYLNENNDIFELVGIERN